MEINKFSRFSVILISLIAILGVTSVLYYTRYGPGLSSDSVAYIQGAINIKNGHGYARFSGENTLEPITGFPPVFSAVLASLSLVGMDVLSAGRVLNAILFGVNIFLVGLLIFFSTRSLWASLLGCMLGMGFWGMIFTHAWLMSEALFILLMLLGFYVFTRYMENKHHLLIILVGILSALSVLTRYAGLSLVVTFALGILLFNKQSWKQRIIDVSILVGVSLIPEIFWVYRNFRLAETMTNRVAGYYRLSYELLAAYANEWTTWLFPRPFDLPWRPRVVSTFSIIVVVSILYIYTQYKGGFVKKELLAGESILPWILFIFIPVYTGAIIFNNMFFDAISSLSAVRRFFLPLFISLVVLMINMVYNMVWVQSSKFWLKALSTGYILVIIIFQIIGSASKLFNTDMDLGLTNARRFWTDVTAGLYKLDLSDPIISDNPQLLYILCGRSAYRTPVLFNRYTGQNEANFDVKLAEMRQRMANGAILVIFLRYDEDQTNIQDEQSYVKRITKGLDLVKTYSHAQVYISPTLEPSP